MKDLLHVGCKLSCYFIIFLALSCKKQAAPDDLMEASYPVSFTINGFKSEKSPFQTFASAHKLASTSGGSLTSTTAGYLYYWSFNQDRTDPDIRLPFSTPGITYNTGILPTNFVNSTYAFQSYPAGRAISITGAREIYFKMPLPGVSSVQRFGFDIGSTDVGPKDFELYYSIDEGTSYAELSLINQFGSMSNSAKNSFSYELPVFEMLPGSLWIKMLLKGGNREGANEYATNGGTMRLDNVYLIGTAVSEAGQGMDKLYYRIFHRDNAAVHFFGELQALEAGTLALDLPLGAYYVSFVSNKSETDLLMPTSGTSWSDFYVSNLFSNARADIFGYAGEMVVDRALEQEIVLNRWYSQVKFEFTDPIDLGIVKRIRIAQVHEPFSYALFNNELHPSISDESMIDQEVDLSVSKQFVFNQFMGDLSEFIPISYQVQVFDANDSDLRTFVVSSTLKNNMQLVFRGELLKDVPTGNNFQIIWNEEWDGTKEEDF